MGNSFKVRRRSSFHAGLMLLMLAVFSYANDIQSAQSAMFWILAGTFWLLFSFRKSNRAKERENAFGRAAFYRHYFGPLDRFAPWIPYLLLFAGALLMKFAPSARWAVWVLLGAAGVYCLVIWFLLTRFLRHWRREMSGRIPPPKPPWDGADGVL
ncbi:MAG: hypothetical protein IJT31_02715 [Oscillibacter sp.]|nr:hypothetical protein [Oscillibacter sp.]